MGGEGDEVWSDDGGEERRTSGFGAYYSNCIESEWSVNVVLYLQRRQKLSQSVFTTRAAQRERETRIRAQGKAEAPGRERERKTYQF